MNNKKYFLGERNNYFFGKLMTVRDFENEQRYHNNKRRLSNRMLNGAGVVSGMGVFLVDNQTISIEMGMAIDYCGREIVIPESVVKKLNTIEGFDENINERILYLYIDYSQDLKETTFSVSKTSGNSETGKEFNRIVEGYRLNLTSKKPDNSLLSLNDIVTTRTSIIENDNIKLSIELPKYANPGELIKIIVHMEKKNLVDNVKYSFKIKSNMFKNVDGGDALEVDFEESELSAYSTVTKQYFMLCDALYDATATMAISPEDFNLSTNSTQISLASSLLLNIKVITRSIREAVIESYYAKHFDDIIDIKDEQKIYLAKLHVIANHSAYFIESLQKLPCSQYLLNNELLSLLGGLEYDRISAQNTKELAPKASIDFEGFSNTTKPIRMNTGVARINLGFSPKSGKNYLSSDIIHGLGNGNVAVTVALENQRNIVTDEEHILLFGDGDIFENGTLPSAMPQLRMGVALYPNKGTMRVGVKLLSSTNLSSIDIRWWAYESENTMDNESETYSDSIKVSITPTTVQIKPMEQARFTASISGMINQEINWSVKEQGSGTIDSNGIYTAPLKEGVYAIMAQSAKYEQKSSIAYVVVKA